MPRHLTITEAATILGLDTAPGRRRIQRACAARHLRGARLIGRIWTIPITAITDDAGNPDPTKLLPRGRPKK